MSIKALLFDKKYYTIRQANAFLKRNNFDASRCSARASDKIKPYHITNKYMRARLIERSRMRAHAREPNYKKYIYRKGNITTGIDCIYQFIR